MFSFGKVPGSRYFDAVGEVVGRPQLPDGGGSVVISLAEEGERKPQVKANSSQFL